MLSAYASLEGIRTNSKIRKFGKSQLPSIRPSLRNDGIEQSGYKVDRKRHVLSSVVQSGISEYTMLHSCIEVCDTKLSDANTDRPLCRCVEASSGCQEPSSTLSRCAVQAFSFAVHTLYFASVIVSLPMAVSCEEPPESPGCLVSLKIGPGCATFKQNAAAITILYG